MSQSFIICFTVGWSLGIVISTIPLIAYSAIIVEQGSSQGATASLLIGWIFQAIMATLVCACCWCMGNAADAWDQMDEVRDMETATILEQSTTSGEPFI